MVKSIKITTRAKLKQELQIKVNEARKTFSETAYKDFEGRKLNPGMQTQNPKEAAAHVLEVFKDFKFNSKAIYKHNNEINKAWEEYKKVLKTKRLIDPKTGKPKQISEAAKPEFALYYVAGILHLFNPYDTTPAYISGDINIKGYKVQVKAQKGSFRIGYSRKQFEKDTQIYSHDLTKEAILNNPIGCKYCLVDPNKLNDLNEKLRFMKLYQEMSNANWYLFFVSKDYFVISVKKENLLNFVRIFQEYFTFLFDNQMGEYKLFFDFNKTIGYKYWKLILLDTFFPIHNFDDLLFYTKRGSVINGEIVPKKRMISNYNISEINKYRESVLSDYKNFIMIHNIFFGGLKYEVKKY